MRQRVIRLGPRGGRVVREHLGPDGRMRYEYDRPGGPAPTRQAAPEPLRPGGRPPTGPGAPHAPADFLRQIEDAARPHGYLLHRLTAPNGPPIAVLTRDEGNRGPRVLVAAGVHGDDRAGPQTLLALFQGTRPRLPGHGVFLPLVNAHGFERGTHGGADGDPNRGNLAAVPSSAEGRTLRAHFPTLLQAARDGFLDLHEDVEANGVYVQTWEPGTRPGIRSARVLGAAARVAPLYTGANRYKERVELGVLLRGESEGSLAETFYRRGAVPAIQFEAPGKAPLALRVACGLAAVRAFLVG